MKNYSILSKVVLIFCACGIIATVINLFTGIINTTITAGGSDICIMGVVIAVSTITTLEQEKEKGQRNKYIDREIPIYRIRLMNNINKLST